MNTWTFKLVDQPSPYLRQGVHGLWSLLTHGEKDDHYPEVQQSPTLRWELTPDGVTIHWENPSDLEQLMNCQLGDFRHGIGVPPGFETNPDKPGFYLTARAHLGIVGNQFSTRRGGRRSYSSKPSKIDNKPAKSLKQEKLRLKSNAEILSRLQAVEAFVALYGPPVTVLETLIRPGGTEDAPHKLKLEITPHLRTTPDQWLRIGGGKRSRLPKKLPAGNVIHPGLAKWNDIPIDLTPQNYFLASFSCLSYLWTYSTQAGAAVGLSLGCLSLTEANQMRRLWTVSGHNVLTVHGDYKLACWAIASQLNLPDRSYDILHMIDQKSVVGIFRPNSHRRYGRDKVYEILDKITEVAGTDRGLACAREVRDLPVFKTTDTSKSVFDLLVSNLEHGRPWCMGLAGVVTAHRNADKPKATPKYGLWSREQQIISTLAYLLGDPMERRIFQQMTRIFYALQGVYTSKYGTTELLPYDRAIRFAVKTHLNKATHPVAVLGAINAIIIEAEHRCVFSDEQNMWLIAKATENPVYLKNLLTLACGVKRPKDTQDKDTQDKDTPQDNDTDEFAKDNVQQAS